MGECARRTTISEMLCGGVARRKLLLSKRHIAGIWKTLRVWGKIMHLPSDWGKGHISIWQWPEAYSATVASGPVFECPWVAQPKPKLEPLKTSVERPEDGTDAPHLIWLSLWGSARKNGRNSTNTGIQSLQNHIQEKMKL